MLDSLPHLFVSLLNFAVRTNVAIDNLVCVEDVLPDIEQCVGISESKRDKGRVHTQDALHVFLVLLNVVRTHGFVGRITDITVPVDKILMVVSTNYHRIG